MLPHEEMIDNIVILNGGEFRRQAQVLFPPHQPSLGMDQSSAGYLQHSHLAMGTRQGRLHHCLPLHRSMYLSPHQCPVSTAKGVPIRMPTLLPVALSMGETILIEDHSMAVRHRWYQVLVAPHLQLPKFALEVTCERHMVMTSTAKAGRHQSQVFGKYLHAGVVETGFHCLIDPPLMHFNHSRSAVITSLAFYTLSLVTMLNWYSPYVLVTIRLLFGCGSNNSRNQYENKIALRKQALSRKEDDNMFSCSPGIFFRWIFCWLR